jgi:hypothetical protein
LSKVGPRPSALGAELCARNLIAPATRSAPAVAVQYAAPFSNN